MSAVTVERPKQLRSTHPLLFIPPPLSFPSLLPTNPPNIKGSLWHGLGWAGRLAGAAALRAIYGLILYERPTVKLESHQPCSFILVSSSSIRLTRLLTHTSMPLVPLPPPLFLRDGGATDCIIATCWHGGTCGPRDKDGGKTCRGKCCPEAFSDPALKRACERMILWLNMPIESALHQLSDGLVTCVIPHLDAGYTFAAAVTLHIFF